MSKAALVGVVCAVMLAGCLDSNELAEARSRIADTCGPAPLSPGSSIFFDKGRACQAATEYAAWNAYHRDVEAWSACVEGRAF